MSEQQAVPKGGTGGGTEAAGGRYSVPQAARYLGISERAVRKRITAGTLPAAKNGNQWVIFMPAEPDAVLPSEPGAVPDGTTSGPGGGTERGTGAVPPEPEPIEAAYRISPEDLEQTIARTGERYLSDMETIFERVDALYRAQIEAKDETIGELRHRARQVEQERDDLRRRLEDQLAAMDDDEGPISIAEAENVISRQQAKELEAERDELRRRAEAAESRVSDLEQRRVESLQQVQIAAQERLQASWWRRLLRLDS